MPLTSVEVQHLAQLCRIALADEEVPRYTEQLSSILSYVDQLQEVDVTGVDAVANITGLENIMRDDELRSAPPEERERILSQFPMREGELLKTRGVFGG